MACGLALSATACGEPLLVLGDLPGFMRIVAGRPQGPGQAVDSIATRAQLTSPTGIAALPNGDLIVVDATHRILRITPGGRFEVLFRGPDCFDQSCLTGAQGIAVLGGSILIADNLSDHIWRFNLETRQLGIFAGNSRHGSAPDGSLAAQSTLASPGDVIVLPDGRVLFTERSANKIRVVNLDGRLGTIAGTGAAGRGGDGGPASAATLAGPTGLALYGSMLYFTDHDNSIVRAIDLSNGSIRTVAGSGLAGFAGDEGPALEAKLNQPWAIDVSADGRTLFVSEIGNHRVRSINLQNGTIATFAGTGSVAYTGNGRSAGETALWNPFGVVATPNGFLFIADTNHQVVWRTPVRF